MASFFEHNLRHQDKEYQFVFQFDDEAIMDNEGKFELQASVRNVGDEEWVSASLFFVLKPDESLIEIWFEETIVGKIDLNELPDEILNPLNGLGSDTAVDLEDEMNILDNLFEGNTEANLVERIIESFPSDPIIGCLVKGAASTLVGQIIRCWYPHREVRPVIKLLEMFRECLTVEGWKMIRTFVMRTGWCVGRMGL